jgi:glycosyltransferase involved in cell wall biosynthesis
VTPPSAPRATVAIPTYNRAAFLRESLESALAQTLADIEIVVSDNASTDETPDVVASFRDPRLTYERLETNVGLHANLSRCLALGSAPYVAVLQDDDLMFPANLERKVAALVGRPQAALAHAPFRFIDERGAVLSDSVDWWKSEADVESGAEFIRGMLERGVRVDMSSWLVRRDAVRDLRFESSEGLAADFGFLLRVALRGAVVYVRETLTATRRHGGALSVIGEARVLPGGHYAPSFAYTLSCRSAADRFLRAHGRDLPDAAALDRASREWARRELSRVVRVQAGDEPRIRPTLRLAARAAAADSRVLLTKRVALTLGWAALGRGGRRVARRFVRRLKAAKPDA